jgi:hypothetical protein
MRKIVGGFKQPRAKLPEDEKLIGHPVPKTARNHRLDEEMDEIINVKVRKNEEDKN